MNPQLQFLDLASRHAGVSAGIGLSYAEAATICLARHHASPSTFSIRDNANESEADASWTAPDHALQNAWANDIDATEFGAYAIALAATEITRGLVAIRRAETRTGADYYLDTPGASPDDLETAVRLEVSGSANGTQSVLEARLKQKLDQAGAGTSNLPAIAAVVGFEQLRVLSADLETA